jgi:hypothetical protein
VRAIWPQGEQRGQQPGRQAGNRTDAVALRCTRDVPGLAARAGDLRRSGQTAVLSPV